MQSFQQSQLQKLEHLHIVNFSICRVSDLLCMFDRGCSSGLVRRSIPSATNSGTNLFHKCAGTLLRSVANSDAIFEWTFFFTISSTMRLFSARWSVATFGLLVATLELPVAIFVQKLVVLIGLFIKPLTSPLVATLVPRLVLCYHAKWWW